MLALLFVACVSLRAQQFRSILNSVEANNVQLQAVKHGLEAEVSEMRAENSIGSTSVEYSPFFESGADGLASSELIVSQEFDFPTQYALRRKVVRSGEEEASVRYGILRRDILLEAQTLCIDLLAAERGASLLAKRKDVTDSLLSIVERRMECGDATRIDVNRLRMESMGLQTELLQNGNSRNSLLLSLRALNGGVPVDSLWAGYAKDDLPVCMISDTVAQSSVLESRYADASFRKAQQESRVAKRGWLPSLTMGYRRNTDLRTPSHGVLLGASFPLFSHSHRVKAAKRKLEAAELEVHNVQLEGYTSLAKLRGEAASLAVTLKAYDEALMYETLRLLQKGVEEGEIPVADYLTQSDCIYVKLKERQDITVRLYKVYAEYMSNGL